MKKFILLLFLLTSLLYGQSIELIKEDGVLTCDTAGIAYIASTQAYGEFTFDLYKGADANEFLIYFISSTNGVSGNRYRLRLSDSERVYLQKDAGTLFNTAISYVLINVWYSIKITRTSGTGVFTIYIKGGAFGNSYQLIDVTDGTNPATDNTYTTSAYFVMELDAGDKIRRVNLNGESLKLDDFTVSTGAYSTSGTYFETNAIESSSITQSGLVGLWLTASKDASGTTIYDKSGQSNDGTSVNTPVWTTDQAGRGSRAMTFNGFTDIITPANSTDLGTVHSASGWFKLDTTSLVAMIGSSNDFGALLLINPPANLIYYHDGINHVLVSWTEDSDWHHFATIRNGTSVDFYIDGAKVGATQTLAGNIAKDEIWTIGARNGTSRFEGSLSDIAIYNKALSTAEITANYEAGRTGTSDIVIEP